MSQNLRAKVTFVLLMDVNSASTMNQEQSTTPYGSSINRPIKQNFFPRETDPNSHNEPIHKVFFFNLSYSLPLEEFRKFASEFGNTDTKLRNFYDKSKR